jgi:predicted  nucleic acid-binding Zn-ribbon protein
MVSTKRLYELQEADLELDKHLFSIKELDALLKDDSLLIAARTAKEGRDQEMQKLGSRFREEELEIESVKAKMVTLEKRLYSGIVKQPRELEDLEDELNTLRLHYSKTEDRTLGSMMDLEEARTGLQQAQGILTDAEQKWLKRKADLSFQRQSLIESLSLLRNRRNEISRDIEQSHLSIYNRIRSSHRGHAIARVERNTCHGCRITLPTREVQRARTANDLVLCVSCGRILHVT